MDERKQAQGWDQRSAGKVEPIFDPLGTGLLLTLVTFTTVLFCFLALSDIFQEYAGTTLRFANGESVQASLTEWARCELEWAVARWGLIGVCLSQIGMLTIVFRLSSKMRRMTSDGR